MSKFYIGNRLAFDPDVKLEKVELTQAEYDALTTKKDNVLYLITDAVNPLEEITNTIDQHFQNVTPGLNHIPSGGSEKQVLAYQSDGKAKWEKLNNILPGIKDIVSYGVSWTPEQVDPQLTRVGNMALHRELPIQSGMKGCIYQPKNKKLMYWLDENDWRFRKEPLMCEVNLTNPESVIFLGGDPEYGGINTALISTLGKNQYLKAGTHLGQILSIEGTRVNVKWEENLADIGAELTTITQIEIGSRVDGYDGEVMVYVPGFYIKSWDEPNKKEVRVSQFKIDNTWEYQPPCYVGAYMDTLYSARGTNTTGGYIDTYEDPVLVSVANDGIQFRGGANDATRDSNPDIFVRDLGKCITNIEQSQIIHYTNFGNKKVMTYQQYKNIMYWLCVIEYATFNLQQKPIEELTDEGFRQGGLGEGITNVSNWGVFNGLCPICPNGYTNELGNRTGYKTIVSPNIQASGTNAVTAIRWRGIENPYGDVAQHPYHLQVSIDGVVTNVVSDSNSDLIVPNICYGDSWVKEFKLGSTANIFPESLTSSNSQNQYKCDYSHIENGGTIVVFGGTAEHFDHANPGCIDYVAAKSPAWGSRSVALVE